ncbi:hypothetical protein RKD29_007767 [Streptomyces tendae]
MTIGLDIFDGIAGRLAEGFTCVHVPGLAVNRARRAIRGGEDESDPRDAKVIAEQVMLRDDLRIVELPEETTVELRLLVSHRTTLVTDATARTARLRGLLTGIRPGVERVTDPTRQSSLILLGHYVTPAEIRRAGAARIADCLRRRGVKQPTARTLADAAHTAALAQHTTVVGERRTAMLIGELAVELFTGKDRLRRVEAEIARLVDVHPDGGPHPQSAREGGRTECRVPCRRR